MYSIAVSFGTGRDPGRPRHTGHTFVFGGAPNSLRQPQNILVSVESSTWHSRPITVSYAAMTREAYRTTPTSLRVSRRAHRGRSIAGGRATWTRSPIGNRLGPIRR